MVLGVVSTFFDFSFFGYFVQFDDPKVLQTMWFVGSILTELILLFSIRTMLPFWRAKRPAKVVLWFTGVASVITLALVFLPFTRDIFGFIYPETRFLVVAFGLIVLYFITTEAVKLMFYRFWHAKESLHAGFAK